MSPSKTPVHVTVTGAAGQIGYSLLFRIASGQMFGPDQPVVLRLLEIEPAMGALEGVVMELDDCAFPLLAGIEPTSDAKTAFDGTSWALLVGSIPRKAGMERNDLLTVNGGIFGPQGEAIAAHAASDVRVLVVGNPCNTNCLIARAHAPEIPDDRFFAMTRLDQNRAQSLLAHKAGVPVASVTGVAIWGNHSSTQFPDFENARIDGKPAPEVIDDATWLRGRVHHHRPAARRPDHRGPRRVVGGLGGQRRGRLGAQHRDPDGRRATACRWPSSPTASTARPRASSSGSPSASDGVAWHVVEGLDAQRIRPRPHPASPPRSSSPSAPRCATCWADLDGSDGAGRPAVDGPDAPHGIRRPGESDGGRQRRLGDVDPHALQEGELPCQGLTPGREVGFEVGTVALFVGMLQLVECGVLRVEQLAVATEGLVVQHAGHGHGTSPRRLPLREPFLCFRLYPSSESLSTRCVVAAAWRCGCTAPQHRLGLGQDRQVAADPDPARRDGVGRGELARRHGHGVVPGQADGHRRRRRDSPAVMVTDRRGPGAWPRTSPSGPPVTTWPMLKRPSRTARPASGPGGAMRHVGQGLVERVDPLRAEEPGHRPGARSAGTLRRASVAGAAGAASCSWRVGAYWPGASRAASTAERLVRRRILRPSHATGS